MRVLQQNGSRTRLIAHLARSIWETMAVTAARA
jgi:hypothetical protein